MTLSQAEKLKNLRAALKKQSLSGFIIPHADRFQGENPAPCDERLKWLTGFSGSAGVALVLPEQAIAMTDGRYAIQIRQQVDKDLYDYGDSMKTKMGDWLGEHAAPESVIGYDPWLHTPRQIEAIEKTLGSKLIRLKAVTENPIDTLWENRPAEPVGAAQIFSKEIAGKSIIEKREQVVETILNAKADAAIIALPDSICWLLNVRGSDVDYAPLVLSYAIIYAKEDRIDWIVNPEKITPAIREHLGNSVQIVDFTQLEKAIEKLEGTVLLDFDRAPVWFRHKLEASGIAVIDAKDPCVAPKALKNKAEQAGIENAHIRDGVAMVKFLRWFEETAPGGTLTEISVADKLEEIRAQDKFYRGPSFATIAGFGPNGAIIHYRASEKTSRTITSPGILLLDSGGQYPDGTTDITRTISIGAPAMEIKVNNTLVLKGHIALASAHFPAGTTGMQLDTLARQALWNAGLDYTHGTGHGVGCYLQVHEEAASISPRGKEALKAGMLISNEPGYYQEDGYGIRIESLILVEQQGDMLGFKTVTLCPIDKNLIVVEMLTDEERAWFNQYHERVAQTLMPKLSGDEAQWLRNKTTAI